jgi:phospholipid/cholesterol/gamma-HCH transport system substrate-binding protein
MSPFRKNLMVGLTVLVGAILMGVMLLKFGAAPARWFGPKRIPIELVVDRADGISVGSSVTYRGVSIGNVTEIRRSQDQTLVIIDALVDAKLPPPANVTARIRSQIVGGGSTISLEVVGNKPEGHLQAHAQIQTQFLGLDLLPPEFAQLATELRATAQQLRESKLAEHLDQTTLSVKAQVEKAGKLIESLDSLVSDSKLREDLKNSMANIRTASETANRAGTKLEKFTDDLGKLGQNANATLTKTQAHIDSLAKQMDDRMVQVAHLLDQFQTIASKVEQGKGTAGMLVNDTKLYDSLVDTSRELNLTITDLKLLVKQWTQEGVYIKLNK